MTPVRPEQIAAQKDVSVMTVRRALASGALVGVRIGRNVYVDAASAANWRQPVPFNPESTPRPAA